MKHGCISSALWKPTSVLTPSTTSSSSARSIRRRACSRSTPCVISFAIIGSYNAEMSLPATTPESIRTPGPAGSRYALIVPGRPSSSPGRRTSSADATGSVTPGTIGTPAARMRSRASIFEPIASMASGGGPIQTMSASPQARANPAFSPRFATSTLLKTAIAALFSKAVSLPDTLTVARAASVPFVVLLYAWGFDGHNYWATALFAAAMATDWFDGRIARSRGRSSPLGSLLDPAADKILVLAVLVMLVAQQVVPGWMVALIVVREFLVTALRLAALERGVVLQARDLGKLKTWSQALAAAIGGFAAAGAWHDRIAWWALLVAVVLTWISGLDYARVAPRLWRGGAPARSPSSAGSGPSPPPCPG